MSTSAQVVIAYRKGPRWGAATLIHQALSHAGRTAVIDHMNGGVPQTQFQSAIRLCRVFIPLLGPGDLDRCSQPDDPLMQTLSNAFNANCVVLPTLVDFFSFERNKQFLTGALADLPKLQVVAGAAPAVYGLEKAEALIETLDPVTLTLTSGCVGDWHQRRHHAAIGMFREVMLLR